MTTVSDKANVSVLRHVLASQGPNDRVVGQLGDDDSRQSVGLGNIRDLRARNVFQDIRMSVGPETEETR